MRFKIDITKQSLLKQLNSAKTTKLLFLLKM